MGALPQLFRFETEADGSALAKRRRTRDDEEVLPVWSSAVSFGLVTLPVKLYPATADHDIRFRFVHSEDNGRVRYDRKCSTCGQSVDWFALNRAYVSPGGVQVVLTDADFAALPAGVKNTIDVQTFVPSDQLDAMLLSRCYYLEPATRTAVRAYVLLAAALERVERTALAHFTLREKTRLGALRVRNGVLVLQTMLWPSELRAVPFRVASRTHEPSPQELDAAQALVASMSGSFAPDEFSDDYQIELKAMLDERIETGPVTKVTDADRELDQEVADLVAMLRRTVDENTTPADPDSG